MRAVLLGLVGLFASCMHSSPTPSSSSSSSASLAPTAVESTPTHVAACDTKEHRQMDFWVGDWNVVVHARQKPDGPWVDASGRQHIESILGGCAIAETFTAEGPGAPWSGRSYSSWQPTVGSWRQTWVDDSGSYLAFNGNIEGGAMTLYGEKRTNGDKTVQMRMVFGNVTPTSLHWEWQRTDDDWKTSTAMMTIDYTRR